MKLPLLFITATLMIGSPCGLRAQQDASKDAFSNLPKEKRDEYQAAFSKAVEAYNQKKILSAISFLSEADKLFPQDANLKFFLGVCYAELRNFDKATACYDEALKLNPTHLGTLLNKAEAAFFNQKWKSAYDQLTSIRSKYGEKTQGAGSLIDFKITMCASMLAEKKETAAEFEKIYDAWRLKYSFRDDTPFYFYAKALSEYRKGERSEGLTWVLKAYKVFADPGTLSVWDKVLIDADYLKRHEVVVTPQ